MERSVFIERKLEALEWQSIVNYLASRANFSDTQYTPRETAESIVKQALGQIYDMQSVAQFLGCADAPAVAEMVYRKYEAEAYPGIEITPFAMIGEARQDAWIDAVLEVIKWCEASGRLPGGKDASEQAFDAADAASQDAEGLDTRPLEENRPGGLPGWGWQSAGLSRPASVDPLNTARVQSMSEYPKCRDCGASAFDVDMDQRTDGSPWFCHDRQACENRSAKLKKTISTQSVETGRFSCSSENASNGPKDCADVQSGSSPESIREQRMKTYGHFYPNHKNLGIMWRGLLQHAWDLPDIPEIPASVVALMMVTVKTLRASFPGGRLLADSYDDSVNYTRIAQECVEFEAGADRWKEDLSKARSFEHSNAIVEMLMPFAGDNGSVEDPLECQARLLRELLQLRSEKARDKAAQGPAPGVSPPPVNNSTESTIERLERLGAMAGSGTGKVGGGTPTREESDRSAEDAVRERVNAYQEAVEEIITEPVPTEDQKFEAARVAERRAMEEKAAAQAAAAPVQDKMGL